jgi:hypothetical protein
MQKIKQAACLHLQNTLKHFRVQYLAWRQQIWQRRAHMRPLMPQRALAPIVVQLSPGAVLRRQLRMHSAWLCCVGAHRPQLAAEH